MVRGARKIVSVVHVCQPPPLDYQLLLLSCGSLLLHTTVSVTKGIGNADVGGRGGVALWVGGNGGNEDMHRICRRAACLRTCDRVARRLDLAKCSMMNMMFKCGR